jgi:hypothetical protein
MLLKCLALLALVHLIHTTGLEDPVLFEPIKHLKLTRAQYRILTLVEFSPYHKTFDTLNTYIQDLVKDTESLTESFDKSKHQAIDLMLPQSDSVPTVQVAVEVKHCWNWYWNQTVSHGHAYFTIKTEQDCYKTCKESLTCGGFTLSFEPTLLLCILHFGLIPPSTAQKSSTTTTKLYLKTSECYVSLQDTHQLPEKALSCYDSLKNQKIIDSVSYPHILSASLCNYVCYFDQNCTGFEIAQNSEIICSLQKHSSPTIVYSEKSTVFRKRASCTAEYLSTTPSDNSRNPDPATKALGILIHEAHESTLYIQDLYDEIYSNFKEMIDHLQFHQVETLGTNERSKRSILGGIGEIFSSLFGFGGDDITRAEVDQIEQNINTLQQSSSSNREFIQKNLALINLTRVDVQANRGILRELSQNFLRLNKTMVHIWDEFIFARNHLATATSILSKVSIIRTGIQRLMLDMSHLKAYLDTLASNTVSPSLINAPRLRNVLLSIQEELRGHPRLQLPADPTKNIWDFYPLLRVKPIVLAEHIIVSLEMPLVDRSVELRVFQAHSLPVLHPKLKKKFQYHLESTYLALTDEDHYVTLLMEADVIKCTLHNAAACKLETALYPTVTAPYCILALYLKKTEQIDQLCKFSLETQTTAEAINLNNNQWAIAMLEPETLEIKCRLKTHFVSVKPPLQIVNLPNGCSAYAPSLRIPAYVELKRDVSSDKITPPFLGFNKSYFPLNDFRAFKTIFPLQDLSPDETEGIKGSLPDLKFVTRKEVPDEIPRINTNYPKSVSSTTIIITILSTIVAACIIAIICFGCFHYKRYKGYQVTKNQKVTLTGIENKSLEPQPSTSKLPNDPLVVKFNTEDEHVKILPAPPKWMTDSLKRNKGTQNLEILDANIASIKKSRPPPPPPKPKPKSSKK